MKRKLLSLAKGFTALVATGDKDGPNDTKWQYMPDMADAPTAKAQESYLGISRGKCCN